MVRDLVLGACAVLACALALPAARADDTEVKPIATATSKSSDGRIGPFVVKRTGVAVRSAEELVAQTSKAAAAKDAKVQQEMEAELCKLLKVEAVDWKKQMVIAVIGEKFDSLTSDGKALTAGYTPFKEPLGRSVPPTPKVLVLVERFDGEVKFVAKKVAEKK